ncbi:MAG: serine/threonine-protein kinase, partial [Planctomycetota bacterium]|nr:serine/threonine-protein kinase [Planctomycetota bacterium]
MHLINVFLKVCDAMSLAHAKGVVHRDLKPENIMVGDFGEVSVLDWGLAKVVGKDEPAIPEGKQADNLPAVESVRQSDSGSQTLSGTVMGTPAFMAPEQAYGNIDEIDPRTDVYALGGILYSILTLRNPVEASSVKAVLIKVTDGDIRPPEYWNPEARQGPREDDSVSLAHCPGGRVPESLSAVAMKALSLKQSDRYQGVKELQMEIEAWQGGYATQAEQAGLGRQLKLLIGRHRTEFSLAASAALLLFAVITGSLFKVNSEKQIAIAEKEKAVTAQQKAERENYFNAIFVADKKIEDFALDQAGDLLLRSPRNLRGWEWGRLMYLCSLDLFTLRGHSDAVRSVSFSPKGEQILTAGFDGTARLWNVRTGKVIRTLKGHRGAVYSASFSRNGKWIVTAGVDKTAILWDAKSGKIRRTLKGHDGDVRSAAISPDGHQILTGSTDSTTRLWPANSSKNPKIIRGHAGPINSVAWSPDGTQFLTASDDRTARLWNSRTGEQIRVLTRHSDFVYCASFSPNGQLLVTGGRDRVARIWDAKRV